MQMQRPEDPAQRQREALGHVSAARMRGERVVAEVSTLKGPAHDLADVDHAGKFPGHPENDESPFVGRLPQALDIRTIRGRRAGRRRPLAEERPAASSRLQEPRFIARRWSPQVNSHLSLPQDGRSLPSQPSLRPLSCTARKMLRARDRHAGRLRALQGNTAGSAGPDADIVRSDTHLAGGAGFCRGELPRPRIFKTRALRSSPRRGEAPTRHP